MAELVVNFIRVFVFDFTIVIKVGGGGRSSMKRGVAKKVSLYVGGLGSGSWKSHDIESRQIS